MNVLSLFDGMACGLTALKRAGIKVDHYFASEIDKYAMKIAKKNHPEIKHIGTIEIYQFWQLPKIDLIIGGSPCQGFSFAGKQLNFKDLRSKLFFDFVGSVKLFNPKYFLLENVKMKKEYLNIISGLLGRRPIEINSARVSAQNRKRLYWCNWEVEQPEDKEILLKDVIEGKPVQVEKFDRSLKLKRMQNKASCLTVGGKSAGNHSDMDIISFVDSEKSNAIISSIGRTTTREYSKSQGQLVFIGALEKGRRLDDGKNLSRNFREGYRIYSEEGKSATLTAKTKGGPGGFSGLYMIGEKFYRRLSPVECERLQTLPDNYTEGVSNTQRYKMIGNGWTVDVIAHILNGLK